MAASGSGWSQSLWWCEAVEQAGALALGAAQLEHLFEPIKQSSMIDRARFRRTELQLLRECADRTQPQAGRHALERMGAAAQVALRGIRDGLAQPGEGVLALLEEPVEQL